MSREILPLTSLRFVAALYVFIFHMQIHFGLPVSGLLQTFFLQGAVGMSLFFILSGFVLNISYSDGPILLKRYAIRRMARIVPVYVLAALVTLPWFATGAPASSANPVLQGIFIVLTNLFFLQAWFPTMMSFWNVGASWSLSVEAFFYALFPAAQPVINKIPNRGLTLILLTAFVASVLPGLSMHLIGANGANYYILPIFRLPEFIVGVALGTAYRRGFRLPHSELVFIVASVVLVAGLASVPASYYVDMNWLAVPCFSAVILAAAQIKAGWLRSILTAKWLVFSGHASYCFYSFQVLIIFIAHQYGAEIKAVMPLATNSLLFASLWFIVLYALSATVYLLFEEPLRRRLTGRFDQFQRHSLPAA
ncbi:acyltransferase [Microvirga sp. BT689]|uniref:acyltransferase family protein n=1 Tax=Microvirga arvi TaxID=2778731 RepID=UPI00194E9B67|nr:acyltransferase [Microvirga arvi]MBM6583760.1 acyltransferase [Microvirga arvi]